MRVEELLARIDEAAPFSLAEGWDNVGLMVGDPQQEVRRLAVALDPLPEAIEEASRLGCQALLVHHPLFFPPLRSLDLSRDPGRAVAAAVRCGVSVLAAHTNWDCVRGGVSWTLAELLGLKEIESLSPGVDDAGLGAVGLLNDRIALGDWLASLKERWKLTRIDCYAPPNCSILKIALCGGSGGELWPRALARGADVYITADVKYHVLLDATRAGLPMVLVDHAEMESASLEALICRLKRTGELDVVLLDVRGLGTPLRF